MRRAIARGQTWYMRLFILVILGNFLVPIPFLVYMPLVAGLFALFLVRPRHPEREPVEMGAPVRGRWVGINSPGSKVPSHGVKAYGQMYAVDLLQPSPAAESSIGWSLRPRPAASYPSFGQPVLAMADGLVVKVRDSQRDHGARNTWPLLAWMMTLEGFGRELTGAAGLLGNYVVVEHEDGTYGAYAHLRRDSAAVRPGDRIHRGQQLAEVGNSGNTSEPHLHVQLMDRPEPTGAAGIPMQWPDVVVDPTARHPRWTTGEPKPGAQPGFPPNGQIFDVT